jgi:hypothetical protein
MERRHRIGYGRSSATRDELTLMYRLGDKSNHIPSLHVPQVYYFLASATIFAWPVLISGDGGAHTLLCEVRARMFGGKRYAVTRKLRRTDAQLAVKTCNGDCGAIGIYDCHRSPFHVSPIPSIESIF